MKKKKRQPNGQRSKGKNDASSVPQMVSRAVAHHNQGDLDIAKRLYLDILEKQPRNFDAIQLLGLIQLQREQYHAAIRYFDKALLINSKSPSVLNNKAVALRAINRFDDSLQCYFEAISLKNDYLEAIINMGNLLHQLGRLEEALSSYRQSLAIRPSLSALFNGGNVLYDLERFEEAILFYDKALSVSPSSVGVWFNLGNAFQQIGKLTDAIRAFGKCLELDPQYIPALNNLGSIELSHGNPEIAMRYYERAVVIDPTKSQLWNGYANSLSDQGEYRKAIELYNKAIKIDPTSGDFYNNLGLAFQAIGDFDNAIASFRNGLIQNESIAALHNNLGLIYYKIGRLSDSVKSFLKALDLKPESPELYNNLANSYKDLDQFELALENYNIAISIDNTSPTPFINRGIVYGHLKQFDNAFVSFGHAIRLNSSRSEAFYNRGVLEQELGKYSEALQSYSIAISLNPNYTAAHNNIGVTLHILGYYSLAVESFLQSINTDASFFDAFNNVGLSYQAMGYLDRAMDSFNNALSINPHFTDARWNKGLLLLLTGDFANGWPDYEYRLQKPDTRTNYYQGPQRAWRGDFDIKDKTLLVESEQGLGDSLHFFRYLPLLVDLCERVIFSAPPELIRLFHLSELPFTIIAKGSVIPRFDVVCPLMSLPLVFKTDIVTIPSQTPYIRAHADRIAQFRGKLAPSTRMKVGIAWSGSVMHKNDALRSIALNYIESIFDPRCDWHVLQKDVKDADLVRLSELSFLGLHFDELSDMADTAALIECLDLVISVDTSIAHLAGAMNKPVWTLIPFQPDFRWLLDRRDSPWYPSMRIFRQHRNFDWADALGEVSESLDALIVEFEARHIKLKTLPAD